MIAAIERETFLEVVEETLRDVYYPEHEGPLPETAFGEIVELREAARSMNRFAVGSWWNKKLNCGCVVGEATLRQRELPREEVVPWSLSPRGNTPWEDFGLSLDERVRAALKLHPDADVEDVDLIVVLDGPGVPLRGQKGGSA